MDSAILFAAELGDAPTIDLHGLTVNVAIQELETFAHQQLMSGERAIKIIHGHGSQKLRDAVWNWLATQRRAGLVSSYKDADALGQSVAVKYSALENLKRRG